MNDVEFVEVSASVWWKPWTWGTKRKELRSIVPEHPNCRCVIIPELEALDQEDHF